MKNSILKTVILPAAILFIFVGIFSAQDIYTSDIHRQNVKKIIFSNSVIKKGEEVPALIKQNFNSGDFIYARAYFNKQLGDMDNMDVAKLHYQFFIDKAPDNNPSVEIEVNINSTWSNFSTSRFSILPNPNNLELPQVPATMLDIPLRFSEAIMKASPGKHKIHLLIYMQGIMSIFEIARGEFELNTSSGVSYLNEWLPKYKEGRFESQRMPWPYFSDKKLEAEIVNVCIEPFAKSGMKPLRCVLKSEWGDIYNGLVIDYRKRTVYAAYKNKKGECFYFEVSVTQPYKGGNTYGKTVYDGNISWESSIPIKCENVNKEQ